MLKDSELVVVKRQLDNAGAGLSLADVRDLVARLKSAEYQLRQLGNVVELFCRLDGARQRGLDSPNSAEIRSTLLSALKYSRVHFSLTKG